MSRLSLRPIYLAFLALLAATCTACGSRLPAPAPDQQRFQHEFADLTVTLDTAAAPLINQPQIFRVLLTDSHGRPVDNADVYLKLDMDMLCLSGSNPVAERIDSGIYQAASVYPMAGEWRIEVVAEVAGDEHAATFLLDVAEAPQ